MDQEEYSANLGKRALGDFMKRSQSTLSNIEERLTFREVMNNSYLGDLGKHYEVINVSYSQGKPVEALLRPKEPGARDIMRAHDAIKQELENFEICVLISVYKIRGILGELVDFGESEKKDFKGKFFIDERDDSRVFEDALDDFKPRFKKRFKDITMNDNPFIETVETEIEKEITKKKMELLDEFRNEINGNIGRDLFKHIFIYTKTLEEIIQAIRNLVGQPDTKISGEPCNPQKEIIKEVLDEKIQDIRGEPFSNHREQVEEVARKAVENLRSVHLPVVIDEVDKKRNEALSAIENRRNIAATLITEHQSKLGDQLTRHQQGLIMDMKDKTKELENIITEKKKEAVTALTEYQSQTHRLMEQLRQQSLHEVNTALRESVSEFQIARERARSEFDEDLSKKIIDISHKLEHLERKEYEISENLRNISQYIQDHPELNTSIIQYWKNLMAFVFELHINAEDKVIPEPARAVWLNGINQTLGALLAVREDRLAERAMREGMKYEMIATIEVDCQHVWNRYTGYLRNPASEDMEYLGRRMTVYAEDQNLKNVAIPAILYNDGLIEFEKNYHSIDREKERSYEEKKRYFREFFVISYNGMIERFRGLMMNMAV